MIVRETASVYPSFTNDSRTLPPSAPLVFTSFLFALKSLTHSIVLLLFCSFANSITFYTRFVFISHTRLPKRGLDQELVFTDYTLPYTQLYSPTLVSFTRSCIHLINHYSILELVTLDAMFAVIFGVLFVTPVI